MKERPKTSVIDMFLENSVTWNNALLNIPKKQS